MQLGEVSFVAICLLGKCLSGKSIQLGDIQNLISMFLGHSESYFNVLNREISTTETLPFEKIQLVKVFVGIESLGKCLLCENALRENVFLENAGRKNVVC
jgi:hypothetical protein